MSVFEARESHLVHRVLLVSGFFGGKQRRIGSKWEMNARETGQFS